MGSEPAAEPTEDVVSDRLAVLVDKVTFNDSRIRRQAPGGVHGMRVTLRRLRSLLATFGPLYDATTVTPLRADLKWVAGELGDARDAEVVRKRIAALATIPVERALADRIGSQLGQVEAAGLANTMHVLESDRYTRTLRDLTSFTTTTATDSTERPEERLLRRRVRRDWKRLRRRANAADWTDDDAERQEALHEVRKAAKRLRYSAETLVPSHGADARRLARRAKRVQAALGELQDSVVAQVRLRGLAEQQEWTSKETFLLGAFHAREEARAAEAEEAYAQAWTRLSRKKHRRWLK